MDRPPASRKSGPCPRALAGRLQDLDSPDLDGAVRASQAPELRVPERPLRIGRRGPDIGLVTLERHAAHRDLEAGAAEPDLGPLLRAAGRHAALPEERAG